MKRTNERNTWHWESYPYEQLREKAYAACRLYGCDLNNIPSSSRHIAILVEAFFDIAVVEFLRALKRVHDAEVKTEYVTLHNVVVDLLTTAQLAKMMDEG